MKGLLAFCIVAVLTAAARAQEPVALRLCYEKCKQEMRACYRINDVIHVDHCDRDYKRCAAACAATRRG